MRQHSDTRSTVYCDKGMQNLILQSWMQTSGITETYSTFPLTEVNNSFSGHKQNVSFRIESKYLMA
jgi:hypothetical protein